MTFVMPRVSSETGIICRGHDIVNIVDINQSRGINFPEYLVLVPPEASRAVEAELGDGPCDAWREVDNAPSWRHYQDSLWLPALVSIRLRVAMAVSNSARAASMQEPS